MGNVIRKRQVHNESTSSEPANNEPIINKPRKSPKKRLKQQEYVNPTTCITIDPAPNQNATASASNHTKDSIAKDIMISYSHTDKEMMHKIKNSLEANGISVWVDVVGLNAGVDFLNKIGQAIIESKMFLSLLTRRSLASKFCQDELALAYISNKPIFPVSIQPRAEIYSQVPTGVKLELARFEWTQICSENFDHGIKRLLSKLKDCLADLEKDPEEKSDEILSPTAPIVIPNAAKPNKYTPLMSTPVVKTPPDLTASPDLMTPPGSRTPPGLTSSPVKKKRTPRSPLYSRRARPMIERTEHIDATTEFWDRNFGDAEQIQWEQFETAFMTDYKNRLNKIYASSDKEWFMDILKRELEVEDELVNKNNYQEFLCVEVDGEIKKQTILKRANDLAVESYSMKEVFNLGSSVRIDAVKNLAKFANMAVVEALLDLLNDEEHHVRASACISLAKTKAGCLNMKIERLIECLGDPDRFVRESTCIALGYLKPNSAVSALLHIWRNDVISSVRGAAELALQEIGGKEVDRAMRATGVLTGELDQLMGELAKRKPSLKIDKGDRWTVKPYLVPPNFTAPEDPWD